MTDRDAGLERFSCHLYGMLSRASGYPQNVVTWERLTEEYREAVRIKAKMLLSKLIEE